MQRPDIETIHAQLRAIDNAPWRLIVEEDELAIYFHADVDRDPERLVISDRAEPSENELAAATFLINSREHVASLLRYVRHLEAVTAALPRPLAPGDLVTPLMGLTVLNSDEGRAFLSDPRLHAFYTVHDDMVICASSDLKLAAHAFTWLGEMDVAAAQEQLEAAERQAVEAKARTWREKTLASPDDRYTAQDCQSCKAPIAFAATVNGKRMPVNVDDTGMPTGSHFATCPAAKAWSGRRRGQ